MATHIAQQHDVAPPRVVFSIDFELRWGVHDILGADRDAYRAELEGARAVVPRLLAMFSERKVRATWATVGALACADWSEYFRRAPPPPIYFDSRLAFDARWAERDPTGELHFAPELVKQIASAPHQELASHTFSHIFLGEPGVMARDVVADTRAVADLFEQRFGNAPSSIVFPRNQVGFLKQLFAAGIRAVRTNPRAWYWNRISADELLLLRVRRFIEGLAPWELHSATPETDTESGMLCTRASLLLRLGRLPGPLFRLHLEKVANEAKRLSPGAVLHLWFHPHNLGADPDASLGRLESVLDTLERHLPEGTHYSTMSDLRH